MKSTKKKEEAKMEETSRTWVGTAEIEKHLGLSRGSVYKLCEKGMPCVSLAGKKIFNIPSVDAWLIEQSESPVSLLKL